MKHWKLLSSKYVFDSFWVRIRKDAVELPGGKILDDFYVIERRDFSVIFGITPENNVVLVRQYKHGVGETMLELPAGFIEDGEPPLDAARREFTEETGFHSDEFIPLGELHIGPSNMNHKAYAYLARGAVNSGRQHLDDTEDIEALTMPASELQAAVSDGRISCMTSVAVISLALQYLENERIPSP